MSWQAIVFGLILFLLLLVTVPVLWRYMAAVYGGRAGDGTVTAAPGDRFFTQIERVICRLCGIDDKREHCGAPEALHHRFGNGISLRERNHGA